MFGNQGGDESQSIFEFSAMGLESTLSSLDEYGKRLIAQGKITETEYARVTKLTKEYEKRGQALVDLAKQYNATDDYQSIQRLTKEFEAQKVGADELLNTVQQVFDTFNQEVDFSLGNIPSEVEGLANTIKDMLNIGGGSGFGGMDDGASKSIFDIAESVQSLKGELEQSLPVVQEFAIDALGALRESFNKTSVKSFDAKDALSNFAETMVTGAGIATTASVALTALSLVVNEFQKSAEKAGESARNYVDTLQENAQRQRSLNELIEAGDVDTLERNVADARASFEDLNYVIDETQKELDKTNSDYEVLQGMLAKAIQMGDVTMVARLTKELGDLGAKGDNLREKIEDLGDQLPSTIADMNEFNDAIAEAQKVQDAIEALQRVADAEDSLLQVRLDAQTAYESFQEQLADNEADYQFRRSRELEDRLIEDTNAQESYLEQRANAEATFRQNSIEQWAGYHESVKDAQTRAKTELEDMANALSDELNDMATQLGESIADAQTEYQESVQETNKTYFETTREALDDHLKGMGEAQDAYNKERKRRLEDLNDELLEAEQGNDVIAFLRAQKSAEKDLRRMKEDFDEQQSQSQDQFDEQQIESRKQHEETLREMRTNADERIAELRKEYEEQRAERVTAYHEQRAERKQALATELADLAESNRLRLKEMQDAHADELVQLRQNYEDEKRERNEQREFMDRRADEDRQRELDAMRETHNARIQELTDQENDLLRVIQSGGTWQQREVTAGQLAITSAYRVGAQNAVSAIQSTMSNIAPVSNQAPQQQSTFSQIQSRLGDFYDRIQRMGRASSRSIPRTAFAEGGVVTSPTLAMLGEGLGGRYDAEAVIPFNRSEGIEMGLRNTGGGLRPIVVNVNPQINATIGDIATASQVTQALSQYNEQMTQTITSAIYKARQAQ
jgi:hypothetical protein